MSFKKLFHMNAVAISPTGNVKAAILATNMLDGDRQVSVTITENNVADATNVVILPDFVDAIVRSFAAAPTSNTTVTSDNYTRSLLSEYYTFLGLKRFSVKDVSISTSDTENLKGELIYRRYEMDGQFLDVKKNLRTLRVNVGNGYSDTVDVPNWNFIKDEQSRIMISRLKRNTSVTLTFTIQGVDNATNMIEVGASSIK